MIQVVQGEVVIVDRQVIADCVRVVETRSFREKHLTRCDYYSMPDTYYATLGHFKDTLGLSVDKYKLSLQEFAALGWVITSGKALGLIDEDYSVGDKLCGCLGVK